MQGKLYKTATGWEIRYDLWDDYTTHAIELHPADAKNYDWMYQSYTPEEHNEKAGEYLYAFKIVKYCPVHEKDVFESEECTNECKQQGCNVAKLVYNESTIPDDLQIGPGGAFIYQDWDQIYESYKGVSDLHDFVEWLKENYNPPLPK